MEQEQFEQLIVRAEQEARIHPRIYSLRVAAISLAGFLILGAAMGYAAVVVAGLLLLAMAASQSGHGGLVVLFFAKLGKATLLLLVPAWSMLRATWTILTTRIPRPQGHPLTAEQSPILFQHLKELHGRLKAPRVHFVHLTQELNAALLQRPRVGLFGWEENYLLLGLPLLEILSPEEALGVIAHELGHLSKKHGRFGAFVFRLRAAWARVQTLAHQWSASGAKWITRMFGWYAPRLNAYTFVLARQHEYDADRLAAELVGPKLAGRALARVALGATFERSKFWPFVLENAASRSEPPSDLNGLWVKAWRGHAGTANVSHDLAEALRQTTDYTDTHPALRERLNALGIEPDSIETTPVESSAAEAWLGEHLDAIRHLLDQRWEAEAKIPWRERHLYLQSRKERLDSLRKSDLASQSEQWEQLTLLAELEPTRDLLPHLSEFLRQYPDDAKAWLLRGHLFLSRDDPSGIGDIERAMEIDAATTIPGCNSIFVFLAKRQDPTAEEYRKRAIERKTFEDRREVELRTVNRRITNVEACDLPPEIVDRVATVVRSHRKGIKQAWLVRRTIESDPDARAYLLVFETSFPTSRRKRSRLVHTLAADQYPIALHVMSISGIRARRIRTQVRNLEPPPLLP